MADANRPVTLAAIAGAHGVRGEVRLKLFGEGAEALRAFSVFDAGTSKLTLKSVRPANQGAVATFAECLKLGRWPGPGGDQQDAEFLSIPPYRAKTIDDRLEAFKVTGPAVGADLQPAE